MISKILKLKKSKAYPAKGGGFVILFAVMISSIILAVALGVENISLKEINFGTSAQDAGDAFFAADVGAECALYYDRSDTNAFGNDNPGKDSLGNPTICAGSSFDISAIGTSWNIVIPNLGNTGKSCAIVSIVKDSSLTPANTIISKGYNTGSAGVSCSPSANSVERELYVNY